MQEQRPQPSQPQQQPKALRFVTNYGAPHPKRRRIGAACLTCRKRKTACSGERPFCETCKQNKLNCTGYSSETPPVAGHKRASSDVVRDPGDEDGGRKSETKKQSLPSDAPKGHTNTAHHGEISPRTTSDNKAQPAQDTRNGDQSYNSLLSGPRNRMPYFRWLGPTAIMPGFKQMVVKVKRQDTDVGRSSTDGIRSPSLNNHPPSEQQRGATAAYPNHTAPTDSDMRTPMNLPFYDTSPVPPSELITHLANTFFTHLGCNYPFLQRDRFLRDLEEKQVDAILVDAVCALAARFSTHHLLTQTAADGENKPSPAEYGHAFAQRAKTALPDTFACPSVAAAQAALLLAYNEFGEQRDSGLWMYLGISIRLAQDLGLHSLEGLQFVGKDGPTPKLVKRQSQSGVNSGLVPIMNTSSTSGENKKDQSPEQRKEVEETRAVEQERVDTFWAIFLLDRYVSSGTGRRSTLRDKDIALSFPSLSQADDSSGWPAPFPALIRIVHLYGRVADLLNSIKEPEDITDETAKRLAAMESQVTSFYQGLSPRLHFDAMNFQHYMKAGEGTNFVLLHFWFHTLIILLHQPTLLKTFEGRTLQLSPNSQQLSMSSAKTIADILSYSHLMDAKASLGNPFTTQPIYIAACAFLKESAEQTATSNQHSRATSPSRSKNATAEILLAPTVTAATNDAASQPAQKASISNITNDENAKPGAAAKTEDESKVQKEKRAKHTLLATAATQHYQLCHKALQSLETYWAGTKYILTILDQKFEGVGDPLLYTTEEAESSMEQPRPEPAFTSPGWRRKLSSGLYNNVNIASLQSSLWPSQEFAPVPGSPRGAEAGKGSTDKGPSVAGDRRYSAIGWTLTGTMDSSSTNLAWHYASGENQQNPNIDPRLSSLNPSEYEAATGQVPNIAYPTHLRTGSTTSQRLAAQDKQGRQAIPTFVPGGNPTPSKVENESVLPLGSPYNQSQPGSIPSPSNPMTNAPHPPPAPPGMPQMAGPTSGGHVNGHMGPQPFVTPPFLGNPNMPMNFMPSDMMIESQDVDMSVLGLDMMPWFDPYAPMMGNLYHSNGSAAGG